MAAADLTYKRLSLIYQNYRFLPGFCLPLPMTNNDTQASRKTRSGLYAGLSTKETDDIDLFYMSTQAHLESTGIAVVDMKDENTAVSLLYNDKNSGAGDKVVIHGQHSDDVGNDPDSDSDMEYIAKSNLVMENFEDDS